MVVLHFGFVIFVLSGGLLALRWQRSAWLHLPCAAYAALIELVGWICPLTPLENRLRELGGGAGHQGGFIEHHLLPLLYPADYTRELQLALGGLVLLVNLLVYGLVVWRVLRARRRPRPSNGSPYNPDARRSP